MNQIHSPGPSEASLEQIAFWKDAFGKMSGDFRLRRNWHAYVLSGHSDAAYEIELDADTTRFVLEVAGGKDAGIFVVVLAAIFHLTKIYTGERTAVLDSPPFASVPHGGLTGTVPLIVEVGDTFTVREHLNHVREVVMGSYTHQDALFGETAGRWLRRRRPATNVLVSYRGLHGEVGDAAAYHLKIEVRRASRLSVALTGRAGVLDAHYLEHFGRHLKNLLAAYGDMNARLEDVPLIDEAEQEKLLNEYARTTQPFPVDRTIVDLFDECVVQSPDNVAIAIEDRRLTYTELNERANQLARHLREENGVGAGSVVAVLADRSELWVIALLGTLKAGGVYLPVDPEYPEERIRFMVDDAGAKALLVHSAHLPLLTSLHEIPMFALDFQLDTLETAKDTPAAGLRPGDAAYIIYTSGSTGQPKGVVVEHGGFVNMVQYHAKAFGVDSSDRLLKFYSSSFDSSLFEVFVALLSGATLVLTDKETIKDPSRISGYVEAMGVSMITAPPIYLRTLDRRKLAGVKRIVSAGDNANVEDARAFAEIVSYINSYGPTETTVCVTHYRVDPAAAYGTRIPVGKPIDNVSIYLLDERMRLVPEGCIGEICIAGVCVARGYLNRADLTAATFVAHPFAVGERIYRTGDLGVWLPDGNLELVGRRDTQVKIRGYRVELGEIVAHLVQHDGVREAVVLLLAGEEQSGDKKLVAYVTSSSREMSASLLREYLKERVPEFMLPSAFVLLEEMPLTANGKINHKALPAPEARAGMSSAYAPPETVMQERLVDIWRETLGIERVGIHDNFFELGGDSILIIQLVSRANRAGLKLSSQQMFERQTIATLAEAVVDTRSVTAEQRLVIGRAPLTPIQRWFFAQPSGTRHHFNQSVMLETPADLEPHIVREAVRCLVEHHDAFRLRFFEKRGHWEQEHAPLASEVPFGVTDVADLTEHARRQTIQAHAARLQSGLNLSAGPLLHVEYFRTGGERSFILFIAHHLVIDGVSWRILLEDFHTVCAQLRRHAPVELPAKTTSFKDWAERLEEYGRTDFEGRYYWLDAARLKVDGVPVDAEVPREENTVGSAVEVDVALSEEETYSLLHKAPQAFNTQINDLLLAALLLAYKEWTGRARLVVDLESHGREDLFEDADVSRTIGWFTSLYPVLLEAEAGASAVNVLKAVKEQLRAVPMRGIGYGLARFVAGDLKASSPAEILFNYLGQTDRVLSADAGWKAVLDLNGAEQSPSTRRSHLLEINGIVYGGRLTLTWVFSERIHRRATIEHVALRYIELLKSLVEACRPGRAHGHTPSDFPGARMDQKTLDALLAQVTGEKAQS